MQINPYGEEPVRLAVDLANRPPTTVADLRRRCQDAGLAAPSRVSATDLHEARSMLAEWTGVVDAADESTRAARLDTLMAAHAARPRLTNHTGDGWHLHFREDRCRLSRVLSVVVVMGTAFHLVGRGMHRLGRCRADGCDLVYADFSRTGTQRYCSSSCGNRDAVRRHRAGLRR